MVIPYSRESSWHRYWTQVSNTAGRFFQIWARRVYIQHNYNHIYRNRLTHTHTHTHTHILSQETHLSLFTNFFKRKLILALCCFYSSRALCLTSHVATLSEVNLYWSVFMWNYLHRWGGHSSLSFDMCTNVSPSPQSRSKTLGFCDGSVGKNPPANAGDKSSVLGPGRSHMLGRIYACVPQLLCLDSRAHAPQQ